MLNLDEVKARRAARCFISEIRRSNMALKPPDSWGALTDGQIARLIEILRQRGFSPVARENGIFWEEDR